VKDILILGTAGNSIDILDTINQINSCSRQSIYRCMGFLDDDLQRRGELLHGIPIVGPLSEAVNYKNCVFVNGIGSSKNFWKKHQIIAQTGIPPERFETIVHPSAAVSEMSRLGHGTVIFQNAVITSNAKLGDHVIVLPNAVISHDDILNDFTCVAGGVCISGGVHIGSSCYLGTNSSIIENITIEDECLIGMGSVVLDDVPRNSVFVGNPARFIRRTHPE
jgi:sugar O-acyltransferase (sialic acid O-acetyltransferase NeuD family)